RPPAGWAPPPARPGPARPRWPRRPAPRPARRSAQPPSRPSSPYRTWSCRPRTPLLGRGERAVQVQLAGVQEPGLGQLVEDRPPDPLPHPGAGPLGVPPPDGGRGREAVGQVPPPQAVPQHEHDGLEARPVVGPRPAAPGARPVLREEGADPLPQPVVEFLLPRDARHGGPPVRRDNAQRPAVTSTRVLKPVLEPVMNL